MDFLITHFAAIVFYSVAVLTVAGAIGVVTFRSPVHSALSLLWTFVMVAVLFVMRQAEFLAAVQLLVYGGGIMVLFLFVIMLVNVHDLDQEEPLVPQLVLPAVLGGLVFGILVAVNILLGRLGPVGADADALRTLVDASGETVVAGNTEAVGMLLYQKFLVPFEVVSLVLLVAMIGAVVLALRHRRESPQEEGAES